MDVKLRTNTDNPALEWRALERWVEPSPIPAGWRATLVLRSGAFAAELPFYFDEYVLDPFLADLRRMDERLVGTALLPTPNEDPFIKLTVDPTGSVLVSGVLVDYEQNWQRLEWSFSTDQTVLRPLIRDFETSQRAFMAGAPTT
jgi:hypothetical protein